MSLLRRVLIPGAVLLLTSACSNAMLIPLPSNAILVSQSATGANDGSSWKNAYTDLQSALAAATAGQEIWVAAGTYRPSSSGNREASFTFENGVGIYGGFAGGEGKRAARNVTANVTVLSGDLNWDGGADFANNGDNSVHVVTSIENDVSAVLDGFTVRGANASNSYVRKFGGGIYNYYSSPTLSNLTVSGNTANYSGGGMVNEYSSPRLSNVTISGNSATYDGGGMYNSDSSSPVIRNSILWGDGTEIYNNRSTPGIAYSVVQGSGGSAAWNINYGSDGGSNRDADPRFTNPASGEYTLRAGSPAVDSGNNSLVPSGVTTDRAGKPRIVNGTVDVGAYERQ